MNNQNIVKNIHMFKITTRDALEKAEKENRNIEESEDGDKIHVWADKRTSKANIKTLPYPGFPTDMQPQMAVLLSISEGTSYLTEGIYDSRFQYTEELKKMGANIRIEGKTACIEGVTSLRGCPVAATDLRAGAALMIAGMCAEGQTELYGIEHIENSRLRMRFGWSEYIFELYRAKIPNTNYEKVQDPCVCNSKNMESNV